MKTWTWFLLGIGIIGLGVGAFNTAGGRAPWDFTDDEPQAVPPPSPGAAVDAPAPFASKYASLFDEPPSKPAALSDPSMPTGKIGESWQMGLDGSARLVLEV